MAPVKANKSLKGASIIEVISAMVIILIVFGIAMQVVLSVMGSSLQLNSLKANIVLEKQLAAIQFGTSPSKVSSEFSSLIIEQEIRPYPNYADVQWVTLKAVDRNGKVLATINQLFYKPD